MIIALASPTAAKSIKDGFDKIERLLWDASSRGAEIMCFPEAYLPGLRGVGIDVPPFGPSEHSKVVETIAKYAGSYKLAVILGTERLTEAGRQIAAYVFDANGRLLGIQTKNQLDPSEDRNYVPGSGRRVFEVSGVKFGIAICHEGWRYPETVRWAAVRGAKIVFHPQHSGSDEKGARLATWGSAEAPYYEKAMIMRSKENTIYFASVNYALRFQESATTLINPQGECQAFLPYGQEGVLVQSINVEAATGLIASRFAPERYRDSETE
jgi:predicted amidohydrolase